MFIHTGYMGHEAYSCTNSNSTFVVSLLLACVSAIGVDLFWMVSGALLLGIEEDARTMTATARFSAVITGTGITIAVLTL